MMNPLLLLLAITAIAFVLFVPSTGAVSAGPAAGDCPLLSNGGRGAAGAADALAAQRRLDQLLAQVINDANAASPALGGLNAAATASNSTTAKKPNILFLIVDDLDKTMETLSHCPNIQKLLAAQGTTFENQFVSMALCCPMRTSIMTGMFPHNNNHTDVGPPGGGYEKLFALDLLKDSLPVRMQQAGYSTYFMGKLVNGWAVNNYELIPPGWDLTDPLLMPTIYQLNNPVFSRNGGKPIKYPRYQTDIVKERALSILQDHRVKNPNKPFFMYLAPTAPHTEVWLTPSKEHGLIVNMTICVPAPRHANAVPHLKVPRTPNFNPKVDTGKVGWMSKLEPLSPQREELMDEWYRARVRCMLSIDEMVAELVDDLQKAGELDNTYFVFTSDNGFHLGHHRMGAGKMTGIEEDIRVPLIIRGPGIAKNAVSHSFNSHTDLTPTLLSLAGAPLAPYFDGKPIDVFMRGGENSETLAVEFWSNNFDEEANIWTNGNAFKSVRILSGEHSFYYSVWCTGDHELYDLRADPYQMHNAYKDAKYARVIGRLDALLQRLRICKAETCRKPWSVLHGAGVSSLSDALDAKYDSFYASQKPYVFGKCSESLYSAEDEGVPVVRLPDPSKVAEAYEASKGWISKASQSGFREAGGPGEPFVLAFGQPAQKPPKA